MNANMIDLTETEMVVITGGDRLTCFISGLGVGAGIALALTTGPIGAVSGVFLAAQSWDNARVNGCF